MKSSLIFIIWSTVGYVTDKVSRIEPVINPWLTDVWTDVIISGPSDLIKAMIWWGTSLLAFTVYKKWIEPWTKSKK